ncbi:MAG: hypothetical protein KKG33_06570 [candidate division Zixibacteria bacterium]|nr:hypothetical protein [candidate division Zixibacteria bacterium]MBU1470204.1 hypothetical protein [candidate division Zixibacteria bacterium]MBU2625207.1 hypothetical protein [candidate division Zixibacteria bacterium]
MTRRTVTGLLLLILLTIAAASCSDDPEPRQTVMHFLQSLRQDTTSYDYLSQLLDLDELVKENSIYNYDSSLYAAENKVLLVSLLQEGGSVREKWLKNQIIVGSVATLGDTATVEVSFIDKESVPVKQYYNKMGVHRIDDQWKIFSFRLF